MLIEKQIVAIALDPHRIIDRFERLRYRGLRLRRGLAKTALLSFGRPAPKPFMVLCRARSGSNFLLSLFEGHPNTLIYGEKLRHYREGHSERFLDHLAGRRAWWVRAVGFKMFYDHPHNVEAPALWQRLVTDQALAIVHLRRRNLLHVLLSQTLAERSDHWVERTDQRHREDSAIQSVEIEPGWLESQFRLIEDQQQEFGRRFGSHPMIEIDYEALVERRQQEFDRICRLLELPSAPARAHTRRQRRRPASELISNYESLRKHFRDSRWAEFFSAS